MAQVKGSELSPLVVSGSFRKCGQLTERIWQSFSVEQQVEVYRFAQESNVIAVARQFRDRSGLEQLCKVDLGCWLSEKLASETTTKLYKRALVGALISEVVARLVSETSKTTDVLTRESAREVCLRLAQSEFDVSSVHLAMAVIVDCRLKHCRQLREVGDAEAIFELPNIGSQGFGVHLREVPEEVRAKRVARRQKRRIEAARRADQRANSSQCSQGASFNRNEDRCKVPVESAPPAEEDFRILHEERKVHPRLPAEANGTSDLAGEIAVAMIRWGSKAQEGKRRPVIVVAESNTHLWVRPLYTKDVCAGGWRALALAASANAPVHHDGFVDVRIRRIRREGVTFKGCKLGTSEWNRLCRGEVR